MPPAGPSLQRLLARLGGAEALAQTTAVDAPFAERVGKWLHWTDAATLHEVLDGPAPAMPAAAADVDLHELSRTLHRTRETIARAIEADCASVIGETDADDAKAWRRRVVGRLQSMQTILTPLRERLRAALATRSPACARLAQVDAVMERALGTQERALLGALLPSLLQRHADRLRADAASPDAWRAAFRRELHAVLMAALDLSFKPLDGLLAALRAADPTES